MANKARTEPMSNVRQHCLCCHCKMWTSVDQCLSDGGTGHMSLDMLKVQKYLSYCLAIPCACVPPCRSCGSVEGRLHSVHERQVWHRVQTEDGQVRPDLRLWRLRSTPPLIPKYRSTTFRSTYLHHYSWQVHRSTQMQSLHLKKRNGTVWQWGYLKKTSQNAIRVKSTTHHRFYPCGLVKTTQI